MSIDIDDFVSEVNEEDIDRFESEFGRQGFWKPKEGTSYVRIFPGGKDMRLPYAGSYQHFFDDPSDSTRSISHNCPRRMARQPCPSCERMEELARSTVRADQKLAESMRPGYRGYFRILDREQPSKGVQVWALTWGLQQEINDFLRRFKNLTHPLEGFDVIVKRRGTGIKTKYRLDVAREPSPIAATREETIALLEAAMGVDVQRYAAVPTYEQCVTRILGQESGGGGGGGSSRALPSGGGSAAPDDWDDGPSVADGVGAIDDSDVPF